MNKTKIEWVKNPDGSQGMTWNPITGCNNQIDGMCQGGNFPCYAYKLANGRLRTRYLANTNYAIPRDKETEFLREIMAEHGIPPDYDPFYPRFWEDKLLDMVFERWNKPRGVFVCDMSDLFGIGVPEEWTSRVIEALKRHPESRFYLLTKQAQNLSRWSPFPGNCWVGVTVTNQEMLIDALTELSKVTAKVKYMSFEPLLEGMDGGECEGKRLDGLVEAGIKGAIIGAQTRPKKLPEWEWVREIIRACDKAGVKVFLKNNLGLPRLSADGSPPLYKRVPSGTWELRQEMPTTNV